MKREIEFRGKSLITGEWVYGSFIIHPTAGPVIAAANPFDPFSLEFYKVDLKTVGQYTGLRDKNRRKIYEGQPIRLFVDGNERIFKVAIETVVRKVKSHPNFEGEYAKVSITAVVFKWEGYDLFPCIDENGKTDLESMEVVDDEEEVA